MKEKCDFLLKGCAVKNIQSVTHLKKHDGWKIILKIWNTNNSLLKTEQSNQQEAVTKVYKIRVNVSVCVCMCLPGNVWVCRWSAEMTVSPPSLWQRGPLHNKMQSWFVQWEHCTHHPHPAWLTCVHDVKNRKWGSECVWNPSKPKWTLLFKIDFNDQFQDSVVSGARSSAGIQPEIHTSSSNGNIKIRYKV